MPNRSDIIAGNPFVQPNATMPRFVGHLRIQPKPDEFADPSAGLPKADHHSTAVRHVGLFASIPEVGGEVTFSFSGGNDALLKQYGLPPGEVRVHCLTVERNNAQTLEKEVIPFSEARDGYAQFHVVGYLV
jgi:hypothetical protein